MHFSEIHNYIRLLELMGDVNRFPLFSRSVKTLTSVEDKGPGVVRANTESNICFGCNVVTENVLDWPVNDFVINASVQIALLDTIEYPP
jgi:hypothetical protein